MRRMSALCAILLALLLVLVIVDRSWGYLPDLLKVVQFPYRLHTYIVLSIAGLLILAIHSVYGTQPARRRRVWFAALILAVAVSMGFGVYQAWSAKRYYAVSDIITGDPSVLPEKFYGWYDFRVGRGEFVERPEAVIAVDPSEMTGDHAVLEGAASGHYATNIVYSEAITMKGDAVVLGRDESGIAVIEARSDDGAWRVVIDPSRPGPIVAGRILSLVGLATVVVLLTGIAVRNRRRPADK